MSDLLGTIQLFFQKVPLARCRCTGHGDKPEHAIFRTQITNCCPCIADCLPYIKEYPPCVSHCPVAWQIGIPDVKFKPAYNPYTEPSMEIFGYMLLHGVGPGQADRDRGLG